MSENKFLARLKGEPTPKSVVEIQNDRLVAPFKSSPMGHIADRDSSVVAAKGAQNWAVNQGQLVPVADDYIGTESDLSGISRVSGAGLWLNATYTFPTTGDETNPVSAIIAPSAKWVLTLCGDSLITQNGSVITLTMLVKIGATHLTTKQFKIRECASQFSQRMAIDFSESEQKVIKAHGGSPLTVQVLCDDKGASATIYSGMTHLTLLQRKVDGDVVAGDTKTFGDLVEDVYNIKKDIDNRFFGVYKFKGTVPTYMDLPADNNVVGDTYNIGDTGSNYTWDGTAWDKLSETVDLSNYATKDYVEEKIAGFEALPDQTGNSGKFLTTNGTTASWSDKPLVNKATNTTSLAIGGSAKQNFITVVGIYAGGNTANFSTIVGYSAESRSDYGVAIGYSASVALNANNAIQLGTGTNRDANTFKVGNANGNFELMSADGTIPAERMSATAGTTGQVLTKTDAGMEWQEPSGGTTITLKEYDE